MTLLRDLVLADQKVPASTLYRSFPERPQFLTFASHGPPSLPLLSPLSDCSLSPLMGEAPIADPLFPQIKSEPLDNYADFRMPETTLANHTETVTGSLTFSVNNNNPGDATPTENTVSLTELDQLLNPELTFYDELQMSGIVKRELGPRSMSEEYSNRSVSSDHGFRRHSDTDYRTSREDTRMEYDSDCDSDGSGVACAESFQEVESEIVRQVKNDIKQARSLLELPSDLKRWTPENVQNWIVWTLKHYNLGFVENLDNFLLDGREFINMTEQDFKARSPVLGAALYAQLDMWQNVSALDTDPTPTSSPHKPRLQAPPAYVVQAATSRATVAVPSSSGPTSPNPLSPTDSSVDNTSFGSSVSSCGSDDESSEASTSGRQTIHLWQFLKMLLLQPQFYGNCIRWIDRDNGIFKIEDSQRVAKLWGKRKNRPAMNYDKLSRSIRQYYKKGIIKKTENSKRLVYRFCHPYLL